jgi:hypothetical protein
MRAFEPASAYEGKKRKMKDENGKNKSEERTTRGGKP